MVVCTWGRINREHKWEYWLVQPQQGNLRVRIKHMLFILSNSTCCFLPKRNLYSHKKAWKNNPDTKHSWNKRSGTSEECGMLKKLFILDRILDLAMWLYTWHLYLKVYSISNKPCSWQNSIPTSTKSIFSRCSPVSWTENLKSNSWAFFLPHLPCIIHQEMLGLLLVHL